MPSFIFSSSKITIKYSMQANETFKDFREKFFSMVEDAQDILITSHKNPDDDSISSVLTIYAVLSERYPDKCIRIQYTEGYSDKWSYFFNFDKLEDVHDIADDIDEFDLMIVPDVSIIERYTNNVEKVLAFKGKKICIDHHINEGRDPENFYDLQYVDVKATSVAELVYYILLENIERIPSRVAELVVMGIMGDTGWLVWNIDPEHLDIFQVVARLVKDGELILEDLRPKFFSYKERVFSIIQEFVRNTSFITIGNLPRLSYSYIDREYIERENHDEIDVKEASNTYIAIFGKTITEVPWACSFYPMQNGWVSGSLRSRPEGLNVRLVAKKIGLGGGHDGSSAMKFRSKEGQKLDSKECLQQFLDWLEEHGKELGR